MPSADRWHFVAFDGGEEEDRTPDLRIANAALSQLSYLPDVGEFYISGFRFSRRE